MRLQDWTRVVHAATHQMPNGESGGRHAEQTATEISHAVTLTTSRAGMRREELTEWRDFGTGCGLKRTLVVFFLRFVLLDFGKSILTEEFNKF